MLQNFAKGVEHRNDVICREVIDTVRIKKVNSRGAKNLVLARSTPILGVKALLPQVMSTLELDGYGWQ